MADVSGQKGGVHMIMLDGGQIAGILILRYSSENTDLSGKQSPYC